MTDVGWLIHQSEIRLRVQQNSLEFFKSRHKYNEYAIKVTPIDLRFREVRLGPHSYRNSSGMHGCH